jgi:uncharacterized protein (TIGR01777 family)
MGRTVVVVGATGFVGRAVTALLLEQDWTVIGASRDPVSAAQVAPLLRWVDTGGDGLTRAVTEAGHVINLAGAHPFARRWSAGYKQLIRDSRVQTTRRVTAALARTTISAPVLVNASGIWFHAAGDHELVHEGSPAGVGFLARMMSDWEAAARTAEPRARVSLLRIGVGVGPGGGVLPEIEPIFRRGLGGPVGSGRQFVPWISLADVAQIAVNALQDDRYHGPFVTAAPNPVTMTQFARAVGAALDRPARLRTPAIAMRVAKGEVAGLMTQSYRPDPRRLHELGHTFHHPHLDDALHATYLDRTAGELHTR